MGVHGLWQLLQSTGQPVTLESLAGKVLGIDVSMWLHQASKGMRDRHGNPIPNAHLVVLFRRVCKLLYFRIKPVFVFDGGVPFLKQQTLAQRRRQREDAIVDADQTAKKLVSRLLQKKVLNLAVNPTSKPAKGGSSSRTTSSEPDIFSLPPMPEHLSTVHCEPDEENAWERRMEQRNTIFSHFEDIEKINTDSEDFASLPAEIKHEILVDLKDMRRKTFWTKSDEIPTDSDDFSKYQLNRLMKQSRLTQHLNKVRKELTAKTSGEIAMDIVGGDVTGFSVEASRVFSEDSSHYFLIKGLRQVRDASTKTEGQEQCSELNDLLISRQKGDDYDEAESSLKSRVREFEVTAEESLKGVLSFPHRRVMVPADSGSLDLSSGETDSSNDDDQTEKIEAVKQKRKMPMEINADEKKPRLEITDTCSVVSLDTVVESKIETNSGGIEVGNVKAVEEALSFTSPVNVLEDKTESICAIAAISDFSPSISANLKDGELCEPVCLSSSFPEEIQEVVDVNSESESSDDEGFIEVEPDSAYDLQDEPNLEASNSKLVEEGADVSMMIERKDDYVAFDDVSRAFKGASQNDLLDMHESLENEMLQLRKERGKQQRLAMSITDQMQVEAQELLNLFGVPYVISPMEAEAQCAFLDLTNQTQGTVTDDSDIWLFGGRHVYRNMFNQNRHVELYTHVDIKSRLLLDREDLIKLALLCGSDYTEGLQGVGPVSALEILAEFPGTGIESLDKFRDWWNEAQKDSKLPKETKVKSKLRKVKLIEGFPSAAVFDAYHSPTIDDSQEPFSWKKPDVDLLRHFGATKLGWNQSHVDELLLPLLKSFNEPETPQGSITDYFLPVSKEVKQLKSSRVRNVINRIRSQNSMEPSSQQTNVARSSKGKATKGLKMKNRKSLSSNCGGFVSSSAQFPTEINLSEESSGEEKKNTMDDEFEVSDDILASIDLDVHSLNAQSPKAKKGAAKPKSTKAKTTKKTRTAV